MIKLRKVILITLIYIGLILINTKVFASTGTTIENTTRLREKPSTDCSTVCLISIGQEVEIIEKDGDWYKVFYNLEGRKVQGYIRQDMLSIDGEISDNKEEIVKEEQIKDSNVEEVNQETKSEKQEQNSIQEGNTVILNNNIMIRILPSINSIQIGEIELNTRIQIKEIINKWCKIETDSITGWILISKIEIKNELSSETTIEETKIEEDDDEKENEKAKTDEKTTENKIMYVNTETVNMREKADTSSKIIKQISLNDTVEVVEKIDDTWSKVSKDGSQGYIASKYLSEAKIEITSRSLTKSRTEETENNEEISQKDTTTAPSLPNVNNSTVKGEEIVAYAKQYLKCKYVSGGASPKTGFDCSGFTYYVFKNFGISLNRSSGAQSLNGVEVSKNNLQLGDLVLFQGWGTTSIGHVGIYIGENSFIHAANGDKGVVITSLSDSYYSKKYVTARRVIN